MSAETLRKAAALMRERAEAARSGRWFASGSEVLAAWQNDDRYIGVCDGSLPEGNRLNAEHIASWHPAVALAVADWLDHEADEIPAHVTHYKDGPISEAPAVVVARAYLGETTS